MIDIGRRSGISHVRRRLLGLLVTLCSHVLLIILSRCADRPGDRSSCRRASVSCSLRRRNQPSIVARQCRPAAPSGQFSLSWFSRIFVTWNHSWAD